MLRALLERTKPIHGPTLLVAGSTWDFATLGRIDRLADNLLLATYLAVLSGLLVLEIRLQEGAAVPEWISRRARWVHLATQFLFGGLFSAYVVFYSRSAGLGRSLLFVILLAALLVVNEVAERHLRGPAVRIQLFFLVVTSFLLFFVPVVTGVLVGLVPAGLGAMVVVALVLVGARRPARADLRAPLAASSALLLALLVLQAGGLVPAVPLSLRDAGAFHAVERTEEGYRLVYEQPPAWLPWRDHDAVFRWHEGERVWVFSAVFAPAGVATEVAHRWERWDPDEGWVTSNRIPFRLEGGRDGGFRGYTYKDRVAPGAWRVRVETPGGREIGRVRFDVVEGEPTALTERIY